MSASAEVFGRDAELRTLATFLAGLPDGPGALVLAGPAGAGKTTLLRAAAGLAARRGLTVLRTTPARSDLRLAFAGLADLPAATARVELARISGRAPGPEDLTDTERRVAELVARGLTNREVAAELFVTARAVESTLTKTYAKLGVRSRTELATRLRREPAG